MIYTDKNEDDLKGTVIERLTMVRFVILRLTIVIQALELYLGVMLRKDLLVEIIMIVSLVVVVIYY